MSRKISVFLWLTLFGRITTVTTSPWIGARPAALTATDRPINQSGVAQMTNTTNTTNTTSTTSTTDNLCSTESGSWFDPTLTLADNAQNGLKAAADSLRTGAAGARHMMAHACSMPVDSVRHATPDQLEKGMHKLARAVAEAATRRECLSWSEGMGQFAGYFRFATEAIGRKGSFTVVVKADGKIPPVRKGMLEQQSARFTRGQYNALVCWKWASVAPDLITDPMRTTPAGVADTSSLQADIDAAADRQREIDTSAAIASMARVDRQDQIDVAASMPISDAAAYAGRLENKQQRQLLRTQSRIMKRKDQLILELAGKLEALQAEVDGQLG